jgi:hypothetical protein
MADPGEKKYIKKKIRPGAIVLDPRETAIVVQYELEGQLLAPDGVTVITELSDGTKRIKVKTLDRRTDIQALADEIVTTCKLIHHSKTGKVRALLAELRDRVEASSGAKTRNEGLEIVHDDDERRERRNAAGRAGTRTSSSARTLSSTRKGTTTPRAESFSSGRSHRERAGRYRPTRRRALAFGSSFRFPRRDARRRRRDAARLGDRQQRTRVETRCSWRKLNWGRAIITRHE